MALQTKLSFVSLDKSARILTIKDSTGSYSPENTEGYGAPNPVDISKVILCVGRVNSSKSTTIEQNSLNDNQSLPSLYDILGGGNVAIDSKALGITEEGEGLKAFSDGVLEVDYFVVFDTPIVAEATTGQNFITGAGLDALASYDQIAIGNERYNINKTLTTNGGVILHLREDIKEDGGELYPVCRANLKILNRENSKRKLSVSIGKLAGSPCDSSCNGDDASALIKVKIWVGAAKHAFEAKDYKEADRMLCDAMEYKLNCNCLC